MEYYGNNDYRDYLAHHGILGMKWGHQNGPPYPLGAGDHSASEKKAGWRQSLSGGSGDPARRKKTLKEVLQEHKAKKAEKQQKAIDEKKKKLVDSAVDQMDAHELLDKKNRKLFTDEEIRDVTKKIDDAAESWRAINARSGTFQPKGITRQQMLEKGKASQILKNFDQFSADELNEAANRIAARQKLIDARRDARLSTIKSLVEKGSAITKDVADIAGNVARIKESYDKITARKQGDEGGLASVVNSANPELIRKFFGQMTIQQKRDAVEGLKKSQEVSDLMKKPTQSDGQSQGGNQNQQQGGNQNQPRQQNQQQNGGQNNNQFRNNKERDSYGKNVQNDSSSQSDVKPKNETQQTESNPKKQGSDGDAYSRMMATWRSANGASAKTSGSEGYRSPFSALEKTKDASMEAARSSIDSQMSKLMKDVKTKVKIEKGKTTVEKAISNLSSEKIRESVKGTEFKSVAEKREAARQMEAWNQQHKAEVAAKEKERETAEGIRGLQSLISSTVKAASSKQQADYKSERQKDATDYERISRIISNATSSSTVDRKAANRREGAKKAAETRARNKAEREAAEAQRIADEKEQREREELRRRMLGLG